jgi:exoribonuclease-2
VLNEQAIIERIGMATAVIGSLRSAERLSNTHWKLVYLLQNPEWQGEGIILEQRGSRSVILLPDLELETEVYLKDDLPLDSIISIVCTGVNLPQLEAHFHV